MFEFFRKRREKKHRDPFVIDEKPQELLYPMPGEGRYSLPGLVSEFEEIVRNLERVDRELSNVSALQSAAPNPGAGQEPSSNAKVLNTVKSFLSVMDGLDNISSSTRHLLEETQPSDEMSQVVKSLIQAIQIVHQKGIKVLHDLNVKEIGALGENFNPHLHVAVDTTNDPNFPPLAITDVESKGYVYGDMVLRPAHVVVNKGERNGS
jgi:molecular chaperone GrpE (heat shock protein)